MAKIAFIGAGSAKFIVELLVDLFSYDELQASHIALMDIDAERLDLSLKLVQRMTRDLKIPARVESTTDRRRAIDGADYVVITVMVGGLKHYHSDSAIPARYGVFQTVGDTIGPGGVMRVVRTAPVMKGIVDDVAQLAPRAWILNYTNPMAMNVWTLLQCGHARSVGLCHSIQHSVGDIAKWLGIPRDEIRYTAGGINHVDFYLTLEHKGRDIYPDLLAAADRVIAEAPVERVRFELLRALGHWPAESAWHQSEYHPWFRKDQKRVDDYHAETFWGYDVDSKHMAARMKEAKEQIAGTMPIPYERSVEYAAQIIYAIESGRPFKFYGNVRNGDLIENLPPQAVTEVPCFADSTGVLPCRVGRIPPQLAAVMLPHISVHEMAVTGVLNKDRRMVRQAIQADPLAGMVLQLPQIEQMTNELLEENKEYLVGW